MQEVLEFGKSTITNKLLGDALVKTGEISKKNKRGKNTTTDVTLYDISENTFLLDTPGFQTIDIFEIETKTLDNYFIEFIPFIKECEFVGCTHIKEEKCGVKQALKERKIELQRYQNYIKIYNELKDREEHKW